MVFFFFFFHFSVYLSQAIRECIADDCDPETLTKVFRGIVGLMGRRRTDEPHEHLYFKFQNSKQVPIVLVVIMCCLPSKWLAGPCTATTLAARHARHRSPSLSGHATTLALAQAWHQLQRSYEQRVRVRRLVPRALPPPSDRLPTDRTKHIKYDGT